MPAIWPNDLNPHRDTGRSQRGQNKGVWGTEVPQRGPGAEHPVGVWRQSPQKPETYFGKKTIANIVSRDHCINIELAILAEWIKIVSTVSTFSLFSASSCNAHGRWNLPCPPRKPATNHNRSLAVDREHCYSPENDDITITAANIINKYSFLHDTVKHSVSNGITVKRNDVTHCTTVTRKKHQLWNQLVSC